MKKGILFISMAASLLIVTACATTGSSDPNSVYKMVDVATAKELHDRNVLFVDVRNKTSYEAGHIPGAVSIEFAKFHKHKLEEVASVDQEVVFYCYGIQCDYSTKASNRAQIWGYQKVYYFMKGYPSWENAGYPIEQ